MATDVPVVKTLKPKIIKNLENIGQVHQGKIKAVVLPNAVLHIQVNTKNKGWFDEQVDAQQKQQVQDKFAVHRAKVQKSACRECLKNPPENINSIPAPFVYFRYTLAVILQHGSL